MVISVDNLLLLLLLFNR